MIFAKLAGLVVAVFLIYKIFAVTFKSIKKDETVGSVTDKVEKMENTISAASKINPDTQKEFKKSEKKIKSLGGDK